MVGSIFYFFNLIEPLHRRLSTIHFDMFMAQKRLIVVEQSMFKKVSALRGYILNVELIDSCQRDFVYVEIPLFALHGISERFCNFIWCSYDVGHQFEMERSR